MFNSLLAEHKTPFGAVAAGEEMTLRFTLPQGDPRTPSLLLYRAGQPQPLLHTPLCRQGDAFTLRYTPQEPGLYYYGFRLSDGTLLHRAPDGSADYGEGQLWQLTVYDKACDVPQKFAGQVMYQIFPDRYYNSGREKTGVPADRRMHRDWQEEPQSTPDADGVFRCNDYFGGDLAGITEKLPELAALGVGVLYLNPIFEAHSNHRYNTADYLRIDPLLGTEQDFITLCQRAHEHGIKIILDGVFNHTGSDSLYFNKEGRYGPGGAYRDPRSPYRSWYCWKDAAANMYESWWGFTTLPKLNSRDESWREFLCGENGIVRHWLRLGADGWRLDVVDEYPDELVRMIRQAARAEKPDALIIGEVWEDASCKEAYGEHRQYLMGHELDSVMNYPLRDAILAYLNGGTAEHFAETMETLRENYPRDVFYNLMNIIGTHDTARALTVLGVRSEDWKKSRDERAHYELLPDRLETAKRRLRLAAVIQFTMPGSPTIYYGDEAGQQGFEDPFNRRTYPWGAEDREILAFYRRLCEVRADSETLIRGELRFDTGENDALLRYERTLGRSRIIVLVNRSRQEVRTGVNALYALDLLTQREFDCEDSSGIEITVPAETAYLLQCFGSAE